MAEKSKEIPPHNTGPTPEAYKMYDAAPPRRVNTNEETQPQKKKEPLLIDYTNVFGQVDPKAFDMYK